MRVLKQQKRPLALVYIVRLRFGTKLPCQRKTFSGPWSMSSPDRKAVKHSRGSPGSTGCAQTARLASWAFLSGFSLRVQMAQDLCQIASPYSKACDLLKKALQNLLTF